MTTETFQPPASVSGLQRFGTMAAVVGLVLAGVGFAMGGLERFYQAYLVAYTFWLGVALGSLALLMVQHLTGGAWGVVIRRPLEAAVSTLPVMALLFLPIVLGMHDLYHWTHADALSDPVIAAKAAYLNTPFFLARAVFYFVVWIGIGQLLLKWSKEQDATGDPVYAGKLSYAVGRRPAGLRADRHLRDHRLADVGQPALVLDDVGAAVHGRPGAGARWRWRSTCWCCSSATAPMNRVLNTSHFHDLGKFLFAFLMMWAYLTLLAVPDRLLGEPAGRDAALPGALAERLPVRDASRSSSCTSSCPTSLLLSRDVKRDTTRLRVVAAWLIVMRARRLLLAGGPGVPRRR